MCLVYISKTCNFSLRTKIYKLTIITFEVLIVKKNYRYLKFIKPLLLFISRGYIIFFKFKHNGLLLRLVSYQKILIIIQKY